MCEFHDSNGNGFGDIWWTDNPIYFGNIDDAVNFLPKYPCFISVNGEVEVGPTSAYAKPRTINHRSGAIESRSGSRPASSYWKTDPNVCSYVGKKKTGQLEQNYGVLRADRQTDKQTDKQTDGQTDGQTYPNAPPPPPPESEGNKCPRDSIVGISYSSRSKIEQAIENVMIC